MANTGSNRFLFGGTALHNNPGSRPAAAGAPTPADPLGPLAQLPGLWKGTGFNQIWRPFHGGSTNEFLELNQTTETLRFDVIDGPIPNRGLLQADIDLFGLHYLQQINDAVVTNPDGQPAALHLEPGLWLNVPALTDPADPPTVARLASIPHGTAILVQGQGQASAGTPAIAAASITPFQIGEPGEKVPFPQTDLSVPSAFRTPAADIPAVTQAMVDNPNSVLVAALAGQDVISTTTLAVSSSTAQVTPPASGGGTANIAFLAGAPGASQPNALAVQVDATFWIEEIRDASGATVLQLQYSQRVLLDFNGLSWPHVSVATLRKVG